MKINLTHIALPAALLLSACNNDTPEVIDRSPPDPLGDEIGNAAVELPPMVKLSKTFRCKDNSLIFVDYMSDDKTANLRIEKKDGTPIVLKAEEAGKPFVAEGYSVTGPGDSITASLPGKGSQSCKS